MGSVSHPWSVQIEFVEGCNRHCWFCGINGIRSRAGENLLYMDASVAKSAAIGFAKLCPGARYEFAMHGEPTLHPDYIGMVRLFRDVLPDAQFQLTTNGILLLRDMQSMIDDLFVAGIDIIVLDTYYPERDKLLEQVFSIDGVSVWDFYDDDMCPSPWHNHHRKLSRTLIVMDDIGVRDGEKKSRVIMNHAGNASPPVDVPLKKVCTIPFREISVCYDGDVNICCMDWGHEYVCGNILDNSPSDIWFGAEFEAARKVLYQRCRGFSPCARCNAGSGSRAGLLPKHDAPTDLDVEAINATVHSGSPRNGFDRMYLEALCQT